MSSVHKHGLAAAVLMLAAPLGLAHAEDQVIDFEGLPNGTILTEVDTAGGLGPILVRGASPYDPVRNSAVIFDSSDPTATDLDLGTPNEAFGGPGVGSDGATNGTSQGNLLIVSGTLVDGNGDGLVDAPDDVAASYGAALALDFSALPAPCDGTVRLKSMRLVDVEAHESGTVVSLYDSDDRLISWQHVPVTGDNGVATMTFGDGGVFGVARMVVEFVGSAAIDDITFDCPGDVTIDCENGLETLTLRYDGDEDNVGVKVTDLTGQIVFGVFPETDAGDQLFIDASEGDLGRLSPILKLTVYDCPNVIETTTIQVDCTQPIGPGYVYGSFVVTDLADSEPGDVGSADDGKDRKFQDKYDSLLWKLLSKLWAACVGDDHEWSDDEELDHGDDDHEWWHSKICPGDHEEPPECDGEGAPCKGGLTDLTLTYAGGGTGVLIEVLDKDGDDLIDSFVDIDNGEAFTAVYNPSVKKDKFPSEITVRAIDNGQTVSSTRIHVSCSQPIAPGFVFGDFVVEAFTSRDEGAIVRDGESDCGWKHDDDPDDPDDPHVCPDFEPIDPIRVNVGGPSYTDSLGNVWSADTGFIGGTIFENYPALVYETDDPDIYRTERFGASLGYAFDVPVAEYEVTFHVAEIYFEYAGFREFSVDIEGETCIDSLDIVRDYWHNEAVTFTCTVCVTDGTLNIDAIGHINNAKLSGIEIVQIGPCGDCPEKPPEECEGEGAPCEGGLTDITLEYQGAASGVRVEVTTKDGDDLIQAFDGVDTGDELYAEYNPEIKKDKFPSEIRVTVFDGSTELSSAQIHVSCSQPIAPGFVYGDFVVRAFTSRGAGTITGDGADCTWTQEPGDDDDDDDDDDDNDDDDDDGAECKGGLTDITLRYDGGLTGVRVEVLTKDGDELIASFNGIDDGDSFFAEYDPAIKKDKFPSEIQVRVLAGGDVVSSTQIHVSCSQPIAPGYVFGDFTVLGFTSKDGGPVGQIGGDDDGNGDVDDSWEPIRVNCGGDDYTDGDGNVWRGDDDEDEGFAYKRGSLKIHDADDEDLYRSERYGSRFAYQFDCPDGLYEVRLKFAEIYFENEGSRLFDVFCEGDKRHASVDLFRQFGYAKAAELVCLVEIRDGKLNLRFDGDVENAKCSAIEVLRLGDLAVAKASKVSRKSLRKLKRLEKRLNRRNIKNAKKAKRKARKNR